VAKKLQKNIEKSKRKHEFSIEDFELNATDKEVFKLAMKYPDKTQIEIAKILSLTNAHVSIIQNKPAYKEAVADFNKNWIDRIIDMRYDAVNKLKDLLNSKNESIAVRAVENILQLDKVDITKSGDELEPY